MPTKDYDNTAETSMIVSLSFSSVENAGHCEESNISTYSPAHRISANERNVKEHQGILSDTNKGEITPKVRNRQEYEDKEITDSLVTRDSSDLESLSTICLPVDENVDSENEIIDKANEIPEDTAVHVPAKTKHTCYVCDVNFKNKFTLKRHQSTKHPKEWYECGTCEKRYPSEEALNAHKEHHLKSFPCDFENCGKVCKTDRHLQLHRKTHESGESSVCKTCGKAFESQGKLHAHEQTHNSERIFKCDVCGKSYKTMDVLTKHLRIHKETFHVYCEICGKGFTQTGSLKRHLDSHDNVKRYNCNVCNKSFSQSLSLQIHKLNAKHFNQTDEKKDNFIKCDICDKTFLKETKHLYEKHLLIHSGTRPYECDVCNKQFNDRSNLNAHKKIHTNSKPFRCNLCDKSFIHRNHLKKHMEQHNKVKSPSNDTALKGKQPVKHSQNRKSAVDHNFHAKEFQVPPGIQRESRVKPVVSTEENPQTFATPFEITRYTSPDLKKESSVNLLTSPQKSLQTPTSFFEVNKYVTTGSTMPTLSVLTPLSSFIPLSNPSTEQVNIPLNIVYDKSSILQLASVSAGVLDVDTVFNQPANTDNLQIEHVSDISNTGFSSNGALTAWPVENVEQNPGVRLPHEATDVDSDNDDHDNTWNQMNKMFTCKSPKDIDHSNENWM